jgi:hypothetical protein
MNINIGEHIIVKTAEHFGLQLVSFCSYLKAHYVSETVEYIFPSKERANISLITFK